MIDMATKDLGRVAVKPRGTWDGEIQYAARDFVYNPTDGCGYLAKSPSVNVRPDTDSTKWEIAVRAGDAGKSAIKPKVVYTNADVAIASMAWDRVHHFPEMPSLTFTLATIPDDGEEHQAVIIFDTPADLENFSLVPDSRILWSSGVSPSGGLAPSTRYEIIINSSSMLGNYAEAALPDIQGEEEE